MRNLTLPHRWYCCLFVLFTLAGTSTQGFAETALNLESAILKTLEQNPKLFQYPFIKKRLEAEKLTDSLSPPVWVEIGVENAGNSKAGNWNEVAEASLSISSVIEIGGEKQHRIAIADTRLSIANFQHQAQTLDVLGGLTIAFINGLTSQFQINLAHEEIDLTKTLLESVERRSHAGGASEADLIRVRARLIEAEIKLDGYKNALQRNIIKISSYWNETSPPYSKLEGMLFNIPGTPPFEALYERVLHSPTLKIFSDEIRLNHFRLQLAKAENRSDVNWSIGIQQFGDSDSSALMGSISIPLFSKKRNSGNVASVLAERNELEYLEKELISELHTQLFTAYSIFQQSTNAAYKLNEELIPVLEQSLKTTRTAYERGRDNLQGLSNAHSKLLAAKNAAIEAASTALINQAMIEQLTGQALSH